jgi:putative transposase
MPQRSNCDSNVTAKVSGELELIAPTTWTRLELLDAAIRPTLGIPFNQAMAQQIAQQLQVHWVTVYRYRRRLLGEGIATALLGRGRGFPTGSSKLSPEQESIIDKVISRLARGAIKLRGIDVFEEVAQRCRTDQLSAPSRNAIDRRLRQLAPTLVVRRKVEDHRQTSTAAGTFVVHKPFDVVQIDHTKCDLLVVDNLYRTLIGRPWLSVAMDVATRSILAILVTFEPPSAATVALLITRIVNAKAAWLKSLGQVIDWPMAGLLRSLHLDNGSEFHSKALGRGCTQFGIKLTYRPPGQPQFGGHIERVIGTLMTKLKTLPGATGHSVKNRKNFAPEKTAALTLHEFECWLAIEIGERYHHAEHRGLRGGTPTPPGNWRNRLVVLLSIWTICMPPSSLPCAVPCIAAVLSSITSATGIRRSRPTSPSPPNSLSNTIRRIFQYCTLNCQMVHIQRLATPTCVIPRSPYGNVSRR